MLSISRRTGKTDGPRRSRGAFAASVAINALLMAAFLGGLSEGLHWTNLLDRDSQPVQVERIGFLQLPKAVGAPVVGRSGGDGRAVTRRAAPPVPAPAAPTTVPQEIPPAPSTPLPAPPVTGSGPVVGAGGATQGIEPTYTDGRLWAPSSGSAPLLSRERAKQRIDSVIAETFGAARDSMLAAQQIAAGQRKPGDWTVNGPGGKWGIDQQSIHLGKVAIPNAILALLSENVQKSLRGNPIQMENDRRLAAVRADLLQHAQREQNEDMFRSAVKEIRARKDRERAAKLGDQKPVVADPNH